MSAIELLSELRHLDVRLWLDGDRLRYRAPQGVMTPERLARLSERKSEVIALLRGSEAATARPPLLPAGRSGDLPLSFAQERLWFIDQWEPGSFAYNIPQVVRLKGRLEVDALARCLREIVRRHEALRTAFPSREGRPVQKIHPALDVPLPVVDLTIFPEERREARALELTLEEARRPFDLSRLPLIRALLLRLADEDHLLVLNLHHIVSDGWSTGVLVGEMGELYAAFATGREPRLPQLPVQYADFARWQRQWLQGEILDEQLGWWRQRLEGAPAVLELPADRPRPPVQSLRGASLFFALPAGLSAELRALAQREGVTLFMILLAAFDAFLHRLSGQEDVVVGSPIANRNQAEIEGLIGFFVNTLALRSDLRGEPAFRELLGRVREATLGAYAHQDLPFEKLVEELHPERDTSRSTLFQVLFALQNAPVPEIALPGLTLAPVSLDGGTSKFDLSLVVMDAEPALHGWLEHSTDLFDPSTIARWAGYLERLLAAVAADPGARISRVPLLGEGERHQVILGWNDTASGWTDGACLHHLVAAQAWRAPEAVALIHGRESLTYGELEGRANRLARRLLTLGAGPEVPVGIFLDRTPEMIVAMLAALKAGAAYLPLDPQYPRERVAFMLADAAAPVVLTRGSLRAALPEGSFTALAVEDGEDAAWDGTDPQAPVTPDNLAYLIYTSGSTGRPKGVAIRHRSAAVLLAWAAGIFKSEDLAGVLASTSICFDLSVFEIFLPLSQGGTVILAENALQLPDLPAAERVTLVNTVPSALSELLRLEAVPAGVRTINLAGEPLPRSLADRIHAGTRARLFNLYGPSEDTTYSTWTLVEPGAGGAPTIGRPIADTRAYVLDARLELAPIGIPGELYLGGEGLARGYLDRPDLTAERFVPDPFSGPGGRLYRTGDLVRRLPSGELDFLGRIDHQVKVRGFRIELGEVEAALAAQAAVREAVVVVHGSQESARLVAYAVPVDEAAPPAAAELRRTLEARLPSHMVPSAFVVLPRLPLTPNGKVDRKALPAPEPAASATSGLAGQGDAPRTATEEVIAGLWSELLGVERVGVHDNFFHLGGHSMLATQAVSRARGALGVEIPLRALFEAPTVAGLAKAVEAARAGGEAAAPPILPVPRDGDLPLSFAQERLWLFEQLVPGTAAYNTYRAARIRGPLEPAGVEWTFREMLRRHEVLRTSFASAAGRPVQVIHPPAPWSLPLVDLAGLTPELREAEALRLANADARLPFDLGQAPLLRATLMRLGDEEHVLALTMHHIVYDVWSGWVLFAEMEALYRAWTTGEPPALPELPIQYADFAHWQRRWLAEEVLGSQLEYWRRQLAGIPAVLEMPTDRPRPPVASYSGGAAHLVLPDDLFAGLRELCRRDGITLFMALLTGFKALLARYSGQEDIPVGSPIANRTRTEVEGLIGFFVNTLVLRSDLSGGPTGREALARIREVALGAYAHQDLPFERLVEELKPERRRGVQPFFQAVLVFVANYPALTRQLAGFDLTPLPLHSGATQFDLNLMLAERQGGLHGVLEYSSELYDAATMERLLAHFQILLAGLAASLDAGLRDLPLLTAAERAQLAGWNEVRAFPRDATLHEALAAQARRRPDAVAAVCEDRSLTYGELNARANRLAHRLRALGVGPEVLVGLYMERSLEMVVGLLAVLKAGGAYLPLDPAYPRERLAFMLEDSGALVVVTQERLRPTLPESGARVLSLDGEGSGLERESAEDPESGARPESLAYVIYTSGSTGRPKGVLVTHANVARLLSATEAWFGFGPGDVWTLFHSYAFDFSVWELWGALFYGGRLVVVPYWVSRSPEAFVELLDREKVTVLNQTPSAFRQLVRAEGERSAPPLSSLRWVIFGGEALELQSLRPWFDRHGDQVPRLVNMYGITETTVHVTWRPVGLDDLAAPSGSPIGQPIPDLSTHLLDRALQPVPVGVPGEILVGGAGLARGYHARPELTAERFIPGPFSGEPGSRLYRSGDLARRLPDGGLEYLGRIDHQVKIRGFRIETGEIESALLQSPLVRECVVLPREDGAGGRRLIAWVVPRGEEAPTVAGLRSFLLARLPDYMVPAAFVVLDRLPLTANGKVDRRALPEPAEDRDRLASPYVPPRDLTEELLAGIWAEVLRLERVGVSDDFFEAGGNSLSGMQIVARLREAFRVEVPLHRVFETPTVAALAEAVRAGLRASGAAGAPAIAPAPRAGDLPLSFAQERLWFLDRFEPGNAAYNIPVAVRLRGVLDVPALARALAEVARRHESLRTTFAEVEGRPVQRVHPPFAPPLPVDDLSSLPEAEREEEVRRRVAADAAHPFDLSRGPLLRARLLRLGESEHALLCSVHHIVSDGWSMGVLVRELGSLYAAFTRGAASPLPELPVQTADFAVWQREWLRGETLEAEVSYWRERLAGAPEGVTLPASRPRPTVQRYSGAQVAQTLPAELVHSLKALSGAAGSTLFMTLLAAFKILLHRASGETDIPVGIPIAGRDRAETEGLIGCFLNTLVLRTDLAGCATFRELLGRVRETALGAYAHREVPFEKLLAELQPERDLSRTPLFQVFFNMLPVPELALPLPGLDLEVIAPPVLPSKFDLTLYVAESDGGAQIDWVYNADLFDRELVEEVARQLARLLSQVAENPDAEIDGLSLLTPEALAVLPDPTVPLSDAWHGAVHELFLERARLHPERIAVVDEEASWTYGELAEAVRRLASRLRESGVQPGDRVAIYAHRSAPTAWAVLGTLAAGAAFVMLDPSYPETRLVEIARLAGLRGWLEIAAAGAPPAGLEAFLSGLAADGSLACRLRLPGGGPEAALDLLPAPAVGGTVPRGPDDIALVAFTSGSTGIPKGILGRHGPLSHFLPWTQERFGLDERDRHSMLSGLSHDPLQRDIFTPLCLGATLCVPPPDEIGTPGRLAAWMARQGVTVANLTPAMAQLLTELPPDAEPVLVPSLRLTFVVGDILTRLDVDRVRRIAPHVTAANFYGSTESQRALGYHVIEEAAGGGDAGRQREILPLGRGMADVQLLVLRRDGGLAGIGEVGEIAIRSPHLAAGYLGDEELTRDRFRVSPFTGRDGDRIYRTGDLGRYLPGGEVAFAGRADQQVKIRGFRIELGEIEAALGRLPGVREAAVIARPAPSGERRLVAYVVPDREPPSLAALRAGLRERLPDYMVPSAFVVLDRLPLTPNGKLDRRALPEPAPDGAAAAASAAPRSPVEEILAEAWAEVLGHERVGIHDDFFELGGHSLLATRVLSRVRAVLPVDLPLRRLFEAPTVAGLAEIVEASLRASRGPQVPPLAPAGDVAEIPLSFAQERMWFLHLLDPDTAAYNIFHAVRLGGRLRPGVLEACFREVLRRHRVLATRFALAGSRPVQVVETGRPFRLPLIDLGTLAGDRRDEELARLRAEEAGRPFDLIHGPVMRAALVRTDPQEHVLLLNLHHIAADGWSMGILLRELAVLYPAFAAGEPSPLAEPAVQYSDFAVWQRGWLQGEALEAQVAFWRERLASPLPVLRLPTDFPRESARTFRVATEEIEIPGPLAAGLRALGRERGASLFMTLLAGFSALLHRATGDERILVGTPIANRHRAEVEGLIGFFLNTLALRADLDGDPGFAGLLARVADAALEGYAHQDLPLETLLQSLRIDREQGLFQVMLLVQNLPPVKIELPELTLSSLVTERLADLGTSIFDLGLTVEEEADGLVAVMTYNANLFEAATVRRQLGHLRALLAAAVEAPDTRLSELPLLSDGERRELLAWNPPLPEEPAALVPDLFAARAARSPEAVAVRQGTRALTYRELDRRANRIARRLLALGAGPEAPVAVCLERSPELIAALLGVLKAGGAYAPLDPAFPRERLASLLDDLGARALVTEESLAGRLPWAGPTLLLDAEAAAEEGDAAPSAPLAPEAAAYVIYTSGSTGRPKGVVVSHGSLARFVAAARAAYGIGSSDRVLQFASIGFDASVEEIYPCLTAGGTLVLRTEEMAGAFSSFLRVCRDEGVTVLDLPTAFWHELAASREIEPEGLPPSVRLVILGGERALPDKAAAWLRGPGRGARLVNTYGPTEATVVATAADLDGEGGWREVPIGRPIEGVQAHVADPALRQVPAGIPGELLLGGDGVARGYLHRPDLTAERFIPDPFSGRPGARLYRTGDLARRRADGHLEFAGRVDDQVKIRGFRVEPGEVEALLASHPAVRECAVVARASGAREGDLHLAAFFVPAGDPAVQAELRAFLAERLPVYMVPSAFVALPALPLTATGKIDRRALPDAGEIRPEPGRSFVAPRSEVEEMIAEIWQEALGIDKVGVFDSFFELGGHSLLLPQVMQRLRDAFEVEVPLRAVYEEPTVAAMAKKVEEILIEEIRNLTEVSPD